VLVVLAVVIIVIGGLYLVRRSSIKRSQAGVISHTRKQLDELKSKINDLPTTAVASRLSLILRHYLTETFDDPMLFETNEELVLRQSALKQLPPKSRTEILDLLTRVSDFQYAPTTDPSIKNTHLIKLIHQSDSLLDHLEPVIQQLSQSNTPT